MNILECLRVALRGLTNNKMRTALTMLGAMREATLYVARAKDHDRARQEAGAVMNRLMQALSAG